MNSVLELRVKGHNRRKRLNRLTNYYLHARNMMYILINKNFDFFLKLGLNDWSLNLLFTDKIINRGNNNEKLKIKAQYEQELLKDPENLKLVREIKVFKNKVGNVIFQSLVRQVLATYSSYFASVKSHKKTPSKFKSKPRLPKAKKLKNINNCSIQFTQLNFKIDYDTHTLHLQCKNRGDIKFKLPKWFTYKVSSVRVVKTLDDLYLQLVYSIPITQQSEGHYTAGIDIGLDNLLTVVSDNPELRSFIVNGRELKALNQWYNKVRAKSQSKDDNISRRKLERYRSRRLKSTIHQITSKLVALFVHYGITTVIVGKSAVESKNGINLGRRNNQNFVDIPFRMILDQLSYKCEKAGIKYIEVEESYTSKSSAISDAAPMKQVYSGKRINRGSYKDMKHNKVFNADCNGALNIIKKVKKDILSKLDIKLWIDKLARPLRLFYRDIVSSFESFVAKVSCESAKRITGSNEEHYIVPSCHEELYQV